MNRDHEPTYRVTVRLDHETPPPSKQFHENRAKNGYGAEQVVWSRNDAYLFHVVFDTDGFKRARDYASALMEHVFSVRVTFRRVWP